MDHIVQGFPEKRTIHHYPPISTTANRELAHLLTVFFRPLTYCKKRIYWTSEWIYDNRKGSLHPSSLCEETSATAPIRVVYDCSCRQSRWVPSLNDCLLQGPDFLNNLCSILLSFWTHTFAMTTNIEKYFCMCTFMTRTEISHGFFG